MISKEDVRDLDFIDAEELASTNQSDYRSGDSLVSTTSSTQTVLFTAGVLLINGDYPIEEGDTIILTGTTGGADGTYTVATIVDDVTLTVSEAINDSTGGSAAFRYPPGAIKVGYDNTSSGLTASNVQDAIDELEANPFNEEAHRTLHQLTHILDRSYYEEYTYTGPQITNVTVWTDSGKTQKVREYDYTYTGPRVTGETEKQYDSGGSLKETITYTYSYTGAYIDNITAVSMDGITFYKGSQRSGDLYDDLESILFKNPSKGTSSTFCSKIPISSARLK